MKIAKLVTVRALGLILVAVALGPGAPTASAQTVGGPAPIKKFLMLLAGGDVASTTSTSFGDIPGMTATVTMGRSGCVAVTLSGGFRVPVADETLALRALLDGTLMEGHRIAGSEVSQLITTASDNGYLLSYTFWKCGVAAGAHAVQLQWRAMSGNVVIVNSRTAMILGR